MEKREENYQDLFFSFEETDVATIVNVAELQSDSFPKLLSSGITFLKWPSLLPRIGGTVLFEELQNLNKHLQISNNIRSIGNRDITYSNLEWSK